MTTGSDEALDSSATSLGLQAALKLLDGQEAILEALLRDYPTLTRREAQAMLEAAGL